MTTAQKRMLLEVGVLGVLAVAGYVVYTKMKTTAATPPPPLPQSSPGFPTTVAALPYQPPAVRGYGAFGDFGHFGPSKSGNMYGTENDGIFGPS